MSFRASADVNAAVTADVDAAVAAERGLTLLGYSVQESAVSPAVATVAIVNGATGAAATKVVYIKLAASGSQTVWLGDGVACDSGISIDHVAGQVDIVLHYRVA